MTKEELNSDRLNYLIWRYTFANRKLIIKRYLQESNYRETAAKLQSEWNVEHPDDLDFANHVKEHALVAILQRGFLYHEAERLSKTRRSGTSSPALGFFGPVPPLSPPLAADEEVTENARKRSIDNRNSTGRPESPAKRTKLSNGYENGLDATPMDLDEPINGNGHAYPSPKEVEVEQPLPIVTTGPERGTHIEKVAELTSETSYLDLSSESSTSDSPILLHCQWSPRDPLRLATAGIDALTRLWTVPSRTPTLDAGRHVTVASRELVDEEGDKSPVSALAWTSDGEILAVASNVDGIGRIIIWSADAMRLQQFDGLGYAPIVRLKWNPTNTLLLALSSLNKAAGGNSYLTVFSPPSTLSATFDLGPDFQPSDATWTGEMEFAICNSEGVFGYKCSDAMINPTKEYGMRREHGATSVIYDPTSHFMIAGSEGGLIDVFDKEGVHKEIKAHKGPVADLKWQPLSNPSTATDENSERLFATAGDDGLVKIWNARGDLSKPKTTIAMESPVLALAFTPDGAFLAAATNTQILIWSMEDSSVPRARWRRGTEPGWQSPRSINGQPLEEDIHSLCWDANGQRLVYGVNSMLAVIKFKPSSETVGH